MRQLGGNVYKIPHFSKEKNARAGNLRENALCPRDVYEAAKSHLDDVDVEAMEQALMSERNECRAMDRLARQLEAMTVDEDLLVSLEKMGIVPINIEDE
ncbi:Aste57867_2110 [Aphanomyces stellatus]|uniref:Aste57867_2110 protein n=1 Tax=Aphanomyces stellatus TaxID=120398 RepID=A0A485KAG9_9STRA|nr:hypothetical protein As57867_002105 [Aphanomyces stellatus]VFT79313.1 Aste57867_2110 [Aphanomyces stellatus]